MATEQQQKEKLYNELVKEVKRANQRLVRLERQFGADSWASKKLRNYLDSEVVGAWTPASRIRLNKSMDLGQLRAVAKATERFLNSSTSRIKGVKAQIKKIKSGFQDKLDISDAEAEAIYQAFEDDVLKWIFQYIEPSDFWAIIQEAKEYNYSETKFIDIIKQYIDFGNDLDIRDKLVAIYERYVL